MFNATEHFYTTKKINFLPPNQTIDGISSNKPDRNNVQQLSDVPDGGEQFSTDSQVMFSVADLNQYEISSDDEPVHSEERDGAARSRPVRSTVTKKRKAKAAPKARGRKQLKEEMEDIFIE